MTTADLTAEQQAALAPGVRLIEAGPGAGKTRTVVARLVARSPVGGVGLLSFTNAAVGVARSRVAGAPGLTEPPNFIGTFDQFFHRYVLSPYLLRTYGVSPTYLASWDDLRDSLAVVRPPSGGTGFRLSQFRRTADGWSVDASRLDRSQTIAWQKLAYGRQAVSANGSARIQSLLAKHVYDTTSARERVLEVLADQDQPFVERIVRRFREIIVDEFQDCDSLEHQVLEILRSAGVHVVVVADPDQAIYEFRQGTTDAYMTFRAKLGESEIVTLSTCFRSTPAICSITTALRSIGTADVMPAALHSGGSEDIHIIVGSGLRAGAAALAIMRAHGVPPQSIRVIAHRRSTARALVRTGKVDPGGVSQMEGFLSAVADLRLRTASVPRLAAIKRIERFVLDQFAWDSDLAATTRAEQLELLDLTADSLRVVISRLLQSADTWTDATSCRAAVQGIISDVANGRNVALLPTLGKRLAVGHRVWDVWVSRQSSLDGVQEAAATSWSHIHGVKGDEFDGVVLALPTRSGGRPHALDDWRDDRNSEARRVLYVGASRAARVLAIVVPKSLEAQLNGILEAHDVPARFSKA